MKENRKIFFRKNNFNFIKDTRIKNDSKQNKNKNIYNLSPFFFFLQFKYL